MNNPDPRSKIASKFLDADYAPKNRILPAARDLRTPLSGQIWHDGAAQDPIERDFAPREIAFADVMARTIEAPLLAGEMVLFDQSHIYLDTSIVLEYTPDQIQSVAARFREALARSASDPLDDAYSDDTVLISHHEGGHTWGHYLCQSLPRILLFLDTFPTAKIAVPAWHAEGARGFGEALALYAVPLERLAVIEADTVYCFKRAILLDYLFNFELSAPHPQVLPLLRRPPSHQSALRHGAAAFIKRAADASRAIGNADDVEGIMQRLEIPSFITGELTLADQIEIWQGHDLVIATLGSDLANIVYARPGTKLLVLSPHWFGDAFFFEHAVAAGVHWYELRCGEMAVRDPAEERNSTFTVDTALLESILSTLL